MQEANLSYFNLVGGTALALQLGHRKSVDLDLFTTKDFNVADLRHFLTEKYGFVERFTSQATLKGTIDGVFIDCIKYDYPFVEPVCLEDGVRMLSVPDIIAMKLSAIADNGTREKDFVDIAFFSQRYSFSEMIDFYKTKFVGASPISPQKGILYYDDIIQGEPINLISGEYDWNKIKTRLEDMSLNPDMKFDFFPIQITTCI